jgi:hypothetical protein
LLSQKAGADLEREKKAESHEEEDERKKRIFEKKIDFCFFRVHCSQNCK